jgi:signal peptidase I
MQRSAATRRQGGLLENVKTILYAGLIALAVRSFLFEPFNIPSGSMIPTLQVGDYLFVSKFSYGYSRFSLPFSPPLFSGRIFGSLPHRGDVAVFKLPIDTSTDYIKRIIGLPGDHIQMRGGHLFINNVEVPREPAGNYTATGDGPPVESLRYTETLPPSGHGKPVVHSILKYSDDGPLDNTQEYVVPPDCVFAMGDNRDNSLDSRVLDHVGYIPVENLVGRAEFIFFSIDMRDPWYEFWYWPFEIRWNRLFTGVH